MTDLECWECILSCCKENKTYSQSFVDEIIKKNKWQITKKAVIDLSEYHESITKIDFEKLMEDRYGEKNN